MAAVPIYVWNGSAWQEIGPTIPASPIAYQASAPASPSTGDIWVDSDGDVTTGSQQFQRFRFVASGGETTISGADADGAILAYTAGLEQVILNGAVLVRGQDYTATDGTNITGLSPALVANDVLEVFSFIAFTVANTYTQSQVDGLIATANASSGTRLLVPGSAVNGTVTAKGTVTFSGVTSVSINDVFSATYDNYKIIFKLEQPSGGTPNIRLRVAGADNSTASSYGSNYTYVALSGGAASGNGYSNDNYGTFDSSANYQGSSGEIDLFDVFTTNMTRMTFTHTGVDGANYYNWTGGINHNQTVSYTGFTIYPSTATFTGSVSVYGYNK
jgi:hypothetical protein